MPVSITLPGTPTDVVEETFGHMSIKGADESDQVVEGHHWTAKLDLSSIKNDDEARKRWKLVTDALKKSGWTFMLAKQEWNPPYASMHLTKNGKEAWLFTWVGDDTSIEVVEKGGPAQKLVLAAPTDGIAKVGPKDDFPFLKHFPNGKLLKTEHDDRPFMIALEAGKDPSQVASGSVMKTYELPANTAGLEEVVVYRDALVAAGWTVLEYNAEVTSNDPNLTAHYAKGTVDLWVHVHAGGMLTVADAGAERGATKLKAELDRACKVAIYGVNFDFDKATLRTDAAPALEAILKLLTDYKDLKLELGGHTDNVGERSYNQTLSENRVAAVKAWLVKKGVGGDRLTTHGYADTVPLVTNDSPENKAKNRRVELKKTDCKK
jgi:OOP family OmpA-OmpF porin